MKGEHFLWETKKEIEERNIERVCGLCDGSYREGRCGVVLWTSAYKKNQEKGETVLTECAPVPGLSATDAEAIGCGILVSRVCGWLNGLNSCWCLYQRRSGVAGVPTRCPEAAFVSQLARHTGPGLHFAK